MKRLFSICITVALLFSLCSCGKKAEVQNGSETVTVAQITYKLDLDSKTASVIGCDSAVTFAVVQDIVNDCRVIKIED